MHEMVVVAKVVAVVAVTVAVVITVVIVVLTITGSLFKDWWAIPPLLPFQRPLGHLAMTVVS